MYTSMSSDDDSIQLFYAYSVIRVDEGNYDGKVKSVIEDPDKLLNKNVAAPTEARPTFKYLGFIPIDRAKWDELQEKQRRYNRSYVGQLKRFKNETRDHAFLLFLRRTLAVMISFAVLAPTVGLAFREISFWKGIVIAAIATVFIASFIIVLQWNSKKERRLREEKRRNKEVLKQWKESFNQKSAW